jgi:Tol biopolymer transport system component/tRNA A-37 threonylcarbamoyl transferase component Bud32
MPFSAGDKLGSYEIVSLLGKGGMGEVWKARDPQLGRNVAIKISAQQFTDRFEREARAIAALNHANVCTLYHIGPNYLVMEYIEGPTLAERIKEGPIPLEEALGIAKQIADALEAAHEKNIVHRDLKPANVKIRPDGSVKVLDFGLAKAGEAQEVTADSPTMMPGTQMGMILGTAGYMSPEQARGKEVDKRADIWAFGVVLYEMVTGKRLFDGATVSDSIAAILKEEPNLTLAPEKTRRLLARCLEKDPKRRLRDIGDWELLLEEDVVHAASAAFRPAWITAVAVLAAALAGAGVAALLIRPQPADLSAYKFTPISREEATERSPAWSPDGKSIAYTANVHGIDQVFTKALGAPDAAQLTHSSDRCGDPFWSPDGATIYYSSGPPGLAADLWAVGASGGTAKLVMEKASGAAVHPDGKTLVFEREGKIWSSTLQGGAPKELGRSPAVGFLGLEFAPDGSKLAGIDGAELWILPWPSGAPRNLGAIGPGLSWLPDSRRLVVGGADAGTLSLLDTADGSQRVIYRSTDTLASPSVSPDGRRIAYSGGATEWDVLEISVPEGRVRTMVGGGGISWLPDWAPSGTHYLFSRIAESGRVIEDRSAAEGFSRRVAEAPQGSANFGLFSPQWAPDGKQFLFLQSPGPRRAKLTIANVSGGPWTVLADAGNFVNAHAWSPDGQWIAFVRTEGDKQQLVKMKPAAGETPVVLSKAAPKAEGYSMIQWSPKGDWIAYPSAEGISLVSPDGDTARKLTARKLLAFDFSKDGAQVYGILRNTTGEGAQWQLWSINVKTGEEKMLAPVDLPASTDSIAGFSMHPDGKRFLTSIARWPFDIWMLEGFDQAGSKTWLDRLFGR